MKRSDAERVLAAQALWEIAQQQPLPSEINWDAVKRDYKGLQHRRTGHMIPSWAALGVLLLGIVIGLVVASLGR